MPVKIEIIRSVGRFEDYAAKGDTTFRDLVALYAPNGNGKSTLSDIFRSLQSGDTDIMFGRHTLNSSDPSEVAIRLQGGKQARFNGKQWSNTCPEIAIFDDTFIEETIHSGNTVEPQQRQRLHQVVIGRESVNIQTAMDAIDRSTKKVNDKISTEQDKLETAFPDLKAKTVCDIPFKEDVDKEIKKLTGIVNNLKQVDEIKSSLLPQEVLALSSPCNVATCLSTELSSIIADARDQVQAHLKSQGMEKQDESWVQKGMKWTGAGNCPFCGQGLENSPTYSLFETYFDEEYNKHIFSLESVSQEVRGAFGDKTVHTIQLAVANNESQMKFWAGKIKTELPELDVDSLIAPAIHLAGAELSGLIATKKRNPTKAVEIKDNLAWSNMLQDACLALSEYNKAVASVWSEVEELQDSLEGGGLKAAQALLTSFSLSKARHSGKISTACDKLSRYQSSKKKLTNKKAELRKKLDALSEEVLIKHGDGINRYLRQFGTRFTIAKLGTSHTGGTPRTSFDIQINKCAVKTTSGKAGTPHFGNTLSTGDKRALAFAFFLSMVNQDPELDDKLIIFDDPFSSLDSFRRSRTKDRILELVGKARVVIVMSHDRDFLWQVTEKAGKQQKALKIISSKEGSVIQEWDINADTLDHYEKDILQLRTYVSGENKNDLLEIARALRTSLEGMFRREFAEMFGQKAWLNDMIEAVKNADTDDRIYRFTPVIAELDDIKEYANPFHHSSVKKDKIAIDPEELRGYCASVLYVLDGDFEKAGAA